MFPLTFDSFVYLYCLVDINIDFANAQNGVFVEHEFTITKQEKKNEYF